MVQNIKAVESFGLLILYLNLCRLSGGRSLVTPFNHSLDLGLTPLKNCLDPTIGQIFHPAINSLLGGNLASMVSITDTLHPSRDEQMGAKEVGFFVSCVRHDYNLVTYLDTLGTHSY